MVLQEGQRVGDGEGRDARQGNDEFPQTAAQVLDLVGDLGRIGGTLGQGRGKGRAVDRNLGWRGWCLGGRWFDREVADQTHEAEEYEEEGDGVPALEQADRMEPGHGWRGTSGWREGSPVSSMAKGSREREMSAGGQGREGKSDWCG